MKRRDFLQALGVGAAIPAIGFAAQAAPHKLRVLALSPKAFSSQFLSGLTQTSNFELTFVEVYPLDLLDWS